MKQFIIFIILTFSLIQCEFFPTEVKYDRPMIPATITAFDLVPPIHFSNNYYQVAGAKFQVTGEIGAIYDVQYKVYGTVRFCDGSKKDAIDIESERVSIADTLFISNDTIHLGTGPQFLTVPFDSDPPRPGQQQYAGTVGISIYYKNREGKNQVSKSESYDYANLYCQ